MSCRPSAGKKSGNSATVALPESTSLRFCTRGSAKSRDQFCSDENTRFRRVFLLLGARKRNGALQGVAKFAAAFAHPLDFARVAAEQIIAQIEPVLHHLEADLVSGFGQ